MSVHCHIRAGWYLPNTLLGMFWIRVIECCLIIFPKVEDGLDVAVVVVWCKRLVTDVHQLHHLLLLIDIC